MSSINIIPPNAAGQPPYVVPSPEPNVPAGPDVPEVPPEVPPGDDVDPAGTGQMDDNIDDMGRKPDGTALDQPGAEGVSR